jgi:hypothetical protein
MTTNQLNSVTKTIDAYFAFLNETDPAHLRSVAEEAWRPDARYVDPHHDGSGRDVLVSMVEAVHAAYPGFSFQRTTGIDAYANQARYGWDFRAPDGTAVMTGVDFATLAPDGRLAQVTGFHGDLPAG